MERSSGTPVKIPVSHPPTFSDKLLTAATISHFLAVRPSVRDTRLQVANATDSACGWAAGSHGSYIKINPHVPLESKVV